jgi:C4-dicarboxylate-binding protein DctP
MKKIVLVLSFLLSSISDASQPIIIKFSHVVAVDTPKGRASEKFKELAEKYTNNAVKVEVFPNSSLYKDREELEALQLGAVQMLAPSFAKFGPMGVAEFGLLDLPYIFPTTEALYKVLDGEVGKKLFEKLQAKGITGLAFWDNGFKQFHSNKPMKKVSDYQGLKMRIQSSKVLEAQMKALGAIPQVMAFSEVYTALQQGVVDGSEDPLSNMFTQKMHEVQKHLTLSNHGYLGYAVVVNKKFWDGLPPEIRAGLEKAMKEATEYERSISKKDNDDALEGIRKAGTTEIYTPTPQELEALKAALLPVHKEFEPIFGKELMDATYKAIASK